MSKNYSVNKNSLCSGTNEILNKNHLKTKTTSLISNKNLPRVLTKSPQSKYSSVLLHQESFSNISINDKVVNSSLSQNNVKTKKDEKNGNTKDSSAYSLRPRRSTPRRNENSNISLIRKFSIFSPNNLDEVQSKIAKLKSNASIYSTKKDLFNNHNEKCDYFKEKVRPISPSKAIVEDVDLNVFAEKILVNSLNNIGKNNLNYICLKIIKICDLDLNLNEKVLKLFCQQADEDIELVNINKPIIVLYLYDEYIQLLNKLTVGKILEIVKFEIKNLVEKLDFKINSNNLKFLPYHIELKPNKNENWVPLISIKQKFEPTNFNLLNVINTQQQVNNSNKYDNISEGKKSSKVVFSSYVVKNELCENSSIELTKSPTIKRFMKTINNKSCASHEPNQLKIKFKKNIN